MDIPPLFQSLGLSLLLGLLVGLQREVAKTEFAGMRTFALISLFGTMCGILAQEFGGWVLVAGFLGVIAVLFIGEILKITAQREQIHIGTTTEVALLLMFAIGAYLTYGHWNVAIAMGGVLAVLLQFKPELHGVARWLGTDDLRAIMQFVLITFIILPVLPNRTYGPLDVFNPFEIWLMVTLIVGISLGGYILYKLVGRSAGIVLGGLLGGAVSSTATTLAYSHRARYEPEGAPLTAMVISLASAVVFIRAGIEIAVVAPTLLVAAIGPLIVGLLLSLAPVALFWWRVRQRPVQLPQQKNPTEMGTAVSMALLYTLILFLLAATKEYMGEQALFLVAGVSGLTDVDAITLSISRLVVDGGIDKDSAWRLILTAILSNLIFKGGMAASLGGWRLFKYVGLLFIFPLLGGVALIWWWPADGLAALI